MIKNCLTKSILLVSMFCTSVVSSFAQNVYCFTDIVYDKESKSFLGISRTSLDYTTALYYDPAVAGTLYDEKERISYDTFNSLTGDFDATVLTRSGAEAPENRLFGIYGDHFMTTYFYHRREAFESELKDAEPGDPPMKTLWYDPLGFNSFGGGQDSGWHIYKGSKNRWSFTDGKSYFLGTTARGALRKLSGQ